MKKISFFLLLFVVSCLFIKPSFAAIQEKESDKEIRVRVSFEKDSVTNRNLVTKLEGISYRLRGGIIKSTLLYMDETLQKQIEDISVSNLATVEKKYLAFLEQYEFETEKLKVERTGVTLDSIVILISQKDLLLVQNLGYSVSYF